jgi:hypothetical protein
VKFCALTLMVMLSGPAFADSECTFSPEHPLTVLNTAAKRYPGGRMDPAQQQIVWVSKNGERTVFGYGGCEDLGSVISRASRMKTPRSSAAALLVAEELAERFWNKDIIGADSISLDVLKESIQANRLSGDAKTFFSISHPHFAEFYVAHEFEAGVDSVSVAWQGNL